MVLVSILGLILLLLQVGFSQQTPEYDNTVGLIPPRMGPGSGVPYLNVVTTSDGFDNFDIGTDFAEPHASANPRNPLWVFNAFNTNETHHTENGIDWTKNNPSFPSAAGDPATAYDSLGNLYYMTMKSPITGTWVVKSTNNGVTWGAAVSSVSGADKNWMAADQTMGPYASYIYATMTSSTSGSGNFARSTDLGVTFAQTFTPTTQSLPGMMVCVGPNVLSGNNISGGCVYVVTNSGSSFAATYTFYRSTNGGATFTQMSAQSFANYVGTNVSGRNSVQNMRTRPYPFIAADNSFGTYRGRLYLVYASNTPSGDGNKPDIFCRYSTDQGATWSGAVTINDDPGSTANHQWHPSIWCDKETGRLYAKWLDTRNAPASDSCEVYASYSDNGGIGWAANQRISNAKMRIDCSTCGGGGTPRYQGDYDAIASNRYSAMLVWTDYRIGTFGSYSAYFPDFAMQVLPSSVTISSTDSTDVRVKVPAVKLYSRSVRFSAIVSPAGNFTFTFPQGDSLKSYPDSLVLRIKTTNAASGSYSVTISGFGPNGTPVHKRTVAVTVLSPPPTITVTVPNGGESWAIGTSQTLTWSSTNLTGNVKIELSTDGGATFPTTIAASTANDGTELWTVSGPVTSTARIRISSVTTPTVTDMSNANFIIVQPTITVSAPNGGENWYIGSSQNILWTSSYISGNVKIELSTDGGSTYPTVISASTANDGTEPWTVSGPLTSTARVRISSVVTPSVLDVSNANFTLSQSGIIVASPNGGETWGVGTSQPVTWTTLGVSGSVMIELSRNGGLTYETLFASTANDGSEQWVVTAPPTVNGLIRISSVSVPSVLDVSNGQFTISPAFTVLTKLVVHDNGGELDSVEFGTAGGATDGISPEYGEYELPPLPPAGLDVRWYIAGTGGTKRDIRDTLGGMRVQIIYRGTMQAGSGGYPVVLRWNRQALPVGGFTLRDQTGGSVFLVNMKQQDSLVIANSDIQTFQVVYDRENVVYSIVEQGWDMMSVPVTVVDRRKTAMFPTSVSSAFGYMGGGYVIQDTLEYGVGYWLKFPTSQSVSVYGENRSRDTIDVVLGWNMIGSISGSIPVGSIIQIPTGIVVSPYFGYSSTGYSPATSIDPMRGYWVKVSQIGKLVLPGSTIASPHRKPNTQ